MSSSRSRFDRILELADAALDRPCGSALIAPTSQPPAPLGATGHPYGALVGLSCPLSIDTVVGVHDVTMSTGAGHDPVVLAVAVSRAGPCVARYRAPGGTPATLDHLTGPLIDIGRRALGLETPRCRRTPLDLVDTSFADRVLGWLLDSDLGDRPNWSAISSSHPLADRRPLSPAELRSRRLLLSGVEWSEVRDHAATGPTIHDADLTPGIARWLDEGALARWLFARHPEPSQVFADVCELLEPPDARAFRAAHDGGPRC